jgi:hypothetical protein
MILGLSGPLSSSRHGVHFAAGSTPFDPFGELDAMNILKVEFHLQDGWESLDTFRSRMWAFGGFAAVQLLDVVVNIASPSFSVEELIYSCGGGKRRIPQTERAIPGAGEGAAVLTVIVPLIPAENPPIESKHSSAKPQVVRSFFL